MTSADIPTFDISGTGRELGRQHGEAAREQIKASVARLKGPERPLVEEDDRAAVLLRDDGDVMRFQAWRGLSDEYRAQTEGHSPWAPDAADPWPVLVADVHDADPGRADRRGLDVPRSARTCGGLARPDDSAPAKVPRDRRVPRAGR